MHKKFKDMPIWQEAMEVVEDVFKIGTDLSKEEDCEFASRIRRLALRISIYIAEAYVRNKWVDKVNLYSIAKYSIVEAKSHLEYGKRGGCLDKKIIEDLDQRLSNLYKDLNKIILLLKSSYKYPSQP